MIYRAIGLMSGSSLDGLDIAFVEFEEIRGQWSFKIRNAETIDFTGVWCERLANASTLSAFDFIKLDNDFGRFTGEEINTFIEKNNLQHQVQLIASHGHTVFHSPESFFTAQIGNGAQIAALTFINVISDLRSLDVALGGQGAPIVPIGEKYLFNDFHYFLNIGGIANLSFHEDENVQAFDVCVANQALNFFAKQKEKPFDENGNIAASGNINTELLAALNALPYYKTNAPKSLSNQYFRENIFPVIHQFKLSAEDILRTYVEHIALQIAYGFSHLSQKSEAKKLLVTGGGAFNNFLIERIKNTLSSYDIEVVLPEKNVIEFKEALIMAFLGILRWREENTVLNNTGAQWPSIGGAVWIGQKY